MKDDRESRKQALLKELADIQSLLDDMDAPAPAKQAAAPMDSDQIRRLAAERANPFLSAGSPPPVQPAPSRPPQQLSSTEIDRMVDNLVEEALPKLEKALRLRLRDALRRKN